MPTPTTLERDTFKKILRNITSGNYEKQIEAMYDISSARDSGHLTDKDAIDLLIAAVNYLILQQ